MNHSKYFILFIQILIFRNIFGQFTQVQYPGIISEKSNEEGVFASFENRFDFTEYKLQFGNNFIQTSKIGILSGENNTIPLIVNGESGTATIGPYLSDTQHANAALTVTGVNNSIDIRLLGHGRLSAQGSVLLTLDDNVNAMEYFIIKNSNEEDLFWVGENGNNRMNGNLHVNGSIKENIIKYHVINFTDFEVIEDYGDELDVGYRWVASDGGPGNSWIGASIHLPHKSVIKSIRIYYFDNDDDGYMDIYFKKSSAIANKIFTGNRNSSTGSAIHVTTLNEVLDYSSNMYYIYAESEEWVDQGIQHILVSYETP